MPLEILAYEEINGKDQKPTYSMCKRIYDKFGDQVVQILQERSSQGNILECEFMANIRIMRTLLGGAFTVEAVHRGKKYPKQLLQKKIELKRKTCVIKGVSRFFIVRRRFLS